MKESSLKRLSDILPVSADFGISGNDQVFVGGFTLDSRTSSESVAFVAKKGSSLDGHEFIPQAIARGCRLVFCERKPLSMEHEVCYVWSDKLPELLGKAMHRFYDNRINALTLVGVTGTNGKTTVARLLFELFSQLGYHCGLLSTVENIVVDQVIPASHTTPDQVNLYQLLHQMALKGCSHVFMEVSSHAIHQQRIAGLDYHVAVFTNITHDHLDYHGTFKDYLNTKKKFFDDLSAKAFAVINKDDPNGMYMVQNCKADCVTYGIQQLSDVRGRIIENSVTGLHLQFGERQWYSRLIGAFNASNLLAVYASGICLGIGPDDLLREMSVLKAVEGRFEYMRSLTNDKIGIIDYAHTPDALEKVLETLHGMRKPNQKIITVMGCGGDRDKTKRPLMAKIACLMSDHVIMTSDNPRFEDPKEILSDMERGAINMPSKNYLIIEDREQAIKTACMIASNQDIILVAGKGHEKYQDINGKKLPFDDKQMLNTFL